MILLAITPDDDQAVADARAWLRAHKITGDEARLIKRDGQVLVIDKAETWRRLKPSIQEV